MEEQRDGQPVSNYGQQTRILPATRTLPAWSEVEIAWDSTQLVLQSTLALLAEFQKAISEAWRDDRRVWKTPWVRWPAFTAGSPRRKITWMHW